MNLAVKFYSQVANPQSIPGQWPAEVKELGESTGAPDGWTLMTAGEYDNYRASHESAMDTWEATQIKVEAPSAPAAELILEDPALETLRTRVDELEAVLKSKGLI